MEKKYKLIGSGNFTLILRGTYRMIIHDEMNRPIGNQTISPLQLVFQNGVPVEVDEATLGLVKLTAHWGNDIAFLPVSLPKDADPAIVTLSTRVAKGVTDKMQERKEATIRAREGSVNREEDTE